MTAVIASPNKHDGRKSPIRVIVIHTMESGETANVAEAVGNYFARPATKASAHVGVDTDSTVRYVPDADTAWAAPGANADGLHLELAGRAGQTTGDWTDAASKAILERAAQQVAAWCKAYGIQVRRLNHAQLADGKSVGIVGHDQVSAVFKRSTHWDPGPAFPWASFLARVGAILGYPAAPIPATVPTTPRPASVPVTKPTTTPTGGLTVNTIDLRDITPLVTGPGVKPLQRLLGLPADGKAGPATRAGLGAAQTRIFGKADYQFGPATATALLAGK